MLSLLLSIWIWALFLLLLLLLLLYLIQAYYRRWFPFQPARFPRKEYYIENQVVVTGAEGDVDAAIADVRNVSLSRVQRLRFSDLGPALLSCPDLPHGGGDRGLVVDLYRIAGLSPNVEQAIREINAALERTGISGRVIAEPNRLTGSAWEPEASPWELVTSAWEPEASPIDELFGGGAGLPPSAPAELFLRQWAFERIQRHAVQQKPSGEGVLVGVFDTSPYRFAEIPEGGSASKTLNWVQVGDQTLNLEVHHPVRRATLKRNSRPVVDVRNHGLFAAGLVFALAERARIRLVRVLDDDSRGDLYTMIEAIFNYIRETQALEPRPLGVVINLSLGIRIPPAEAGFDLPSSVQALEYLMMAARCLGIVTIAASGNEANVQANLPAGWPWALGVAASNQRNRHACFSNPGRIYAPGGDGGRGRDGSGCIPQAKNCQGDCEFALIGPILPPSGHSGYVYWTGTSFAAPLVSGLAALVVQLGQGGLSPSEVERILLCGAEPDEGEAEAVNVIRLPRTLQTCLRTPEGRPAEQQQAS